MAIQANEVHERLVMFWAAVLAYPEIFGLLPEVKKARVKKQVELVKEPLEIVAKTNAADTEAVARAEIVLAESKQMIMWLHDGAKYRYRKHPTELAKLRPMTVGRSPGDDQVRLTTLERELPKMKPAFLWQPDEGLTHESLKKQLKAHEEAMKIESTLGSKEQQALEALRKARPESEAIWDDDDGGLEAFVIAMVPKDLQYTFGRERRKNPRPPKDGEQNQSGRTKQDEHAPEAAGSTEPAPAEAAEQKKTG